MGKKKRRLKDLKNYTPSNHQAMQDVVDDKFGGDMDAFNDWWGDKDDASLDSWEKCRDALAETRTTSRYAQQGVITSEGTPSAQQGVITSEGATETPSTGERTYEVYDTGIVASDPSSPGPTGDRRPVTPSANPVPIQDLDDFGIKGKPAVPVTAVRTIPAGPHGAPSVPDKAVMTTPDNTKKLHDGKLNDCLVEPFPTYINAPCDTVIKGQNNTWIVFGRDRPGDLSTGFGALGEPRSGAIDLVVGRMSHNPEERDADGELISTHPDFTTDAARIYISQKTNIDINFNLADGGIGKRQARSAVGIKADNIRLVAREGIKLVTKTDIKNSQGVEIKETYGIDIIAGNNDSELQPMAKGKNLKEAVERLTHHVSKLNGIVDSLVMAQNQFNIALTHHFHISPFNGIPTSPSPPVVASGTQTMVTYLKDVKLSLMTQKANLELYKANYLTPAGCGYILSRHNKVN